jgi:hypothetical protein
MTPFENFRAVMRADHSHAFLSYLPVSNSLHCVPTYLLLALKTLGNAGMSNFSSHCVSMTL